MDVEQPTMEQHTINLAALKAVLETRGKLGFNVIVLIEMGEEKGSLDYTIFVKLIKTF